VPQSRSQPSLLVEAVRGVEALHRRAEQAPPRAVGDQAGRAARRPDGSRDGRASAVDRCGSPPRRAAAYALGRRDGTWAVETTLAVSDLIGWQAPPACWAVVVVAPGRATELGPPPRSKGRDVGVSIGVDRSGEMAGRLRIDGAVSDHPPEGGRLLDTLRRNLALATAPPSEGTARLLTVLWLAALLDAATTAPARPRWPSVVKLHPAARLILDRGRPVNRADLEAIVRVAPSTLTWSVLRAAEARHASLTSLCPPHTAAWMDTGMYSRWVLADLPEVETLWSALGDCLSPATRRRLVTFLDGDDQPMDHQCVTRH
jgi:hypothetical protein